MKYINLEGLYNLSGEFLASRCVTAAQFTVHVTRSVGSNAVFLREKERLGQKMIVE